MKAKLILVLAGTTFGLLIAEAAIRALNLAPALIPIRQGRYRLSANPDLGYEPTPGVYYTGETLYTYDYRAPETNTLGFRSPEYPRSRAGGTFRIAVVGDSLGIGLWIDKYADTFPGVLQTALTQALGPKNIAPEVLNFSVVGYNSLQEVNMVKDYALKFSPDLVLVEYCHNDRERNDGGLLGSLLHEARAQGKSLAIDYSQIMLKSALYRLVRFRVFPQANAAPKEERTNDRMQRLSRDSVEQAFRQLGELSRREKFKVLLSVFPRLGSLQNYAFQGEHDKLKSIAQAENFLFLDLLSAFQECERQSGPALQIDEYHPSVRGHRCAGEAMARFLVENDLIGR